MYKIEVKSRGFFSDNSWMACIPEVAEQGDRYFIKETFSTMPEAKKWMRTRATTLASDEIELKYLRDDIHYCNRLCYETYCLEIIKI